MCLKFSKIFLVFHLLTVKVVIAGNITNHLLREDFVNRVTLHELVSSKCFLPIKQQKEHNTEDNVAYGQHYYQLP